MCYIISLRHVMDQLWRQGLRKDEHRLVGKVDGNGFDATPDMKNVFIVGPRGMKKFVPGSDKQTPITFSSTMKIDHSAEREYMYDELVRSERERFYDKGDAWR